MTTFTALTTLPGRINASDLGDALERLTPEPIGVGVFELEDGSGFGRLEHISRKSQMILVWLCLLLFFKLKNLKYQNCLRLIGFQKFSVH